MEIIDNDKVLMNKCLYDELIVDVILYRNNIEQKNTYINQLERDIKEKDKLIDLLLEKIK